MTMRSRKIKTPEEIRKLRKAALITKEIYKSVSGAIKPGISEIALAGIIEENIKRRGLKRSFKTIVASGPNAAEPHARPTTRRIRKNDIIVIDFGVIYRGYHSDMTRTEIIGNIPPILKRFYDAVRSVQNKAIKKMRAGMRISELVGEAHGYLRVKGLGGYMRHSLGHGIGVRIHEAPKLSERSRGCLRGNMVVTIEPGLYKKGVGGVRIEDMVLLKKHANEVLTR